MCRIGVIAIVAYMVLVGFGVWLSDWLEADSSALASAPFLILLTAHIALGLAAGQRLIWLLPLALSCVGFAWNLSASQDAFVTIGTYWLSLLIWFVIGPAAAGLTAFGWVLPPAHR